MPVSFRASEIGSTDLTPLGPVSLQGGPTLSQPTLGSVSLPGGQTLSQPTLSQTKSKKFV